MSYVSPKRPTLPAKHLIAKYWVQHEPGFVADLRDPACFACGWCRLDWEPVFNADGSLNDRATWNVRLDVAHLVPHALGGRPEVSNLVLLCHDCHISAPSVRNPEYMLRWMRERPGHTEMLQREVADDPLFRMLADDPRVVSMVFTPEFRQFYKDNVVAVPTETRAAAFRAMLAVADDFLRSLAG
jgi:hypothetical protein